MIYLLLILAQFLVGQAATGKRCKALALSGGGSKGAYEAGVLWGLYYGADAKEDYQYDVVTGVSAGAINAGVIALYAPGDEVAMLDFLSDNWQHLNTSSVFKQWHPLGVITGLFEKSGIFDTSALTDTLNELLAPFETKRKMMVACVDASSGSYHLFNETVKPLVKSVVSSASIPFAFPTTVWKSDEGDDVVCMDGGTVWNINLVSAIERCREQVDSDSDITVDVVFTKSFKLSNKTNMHNALDNYFRFRHIKTYTKDLADIYKFMRAYPEVDFRHLIMPDEPLFGTGINTINFDNATSTFPMQMQGREDGAKALNESRVWFDEVAHWHQSLELQAQFPSIGEYFSEVRQNLNK